MSFNVKLPWGIIKLPENKKAKLKQPTEDADDINKHTSSHKSMINTERKPQFTTANLQLKMTDGAKIQNPFVKIEVIQSDIYR